MATIKRFEDLECWQEARKLVRLIYKLTLRKEFRKDFELVRQVRKSAVSSMANIAEGFHRSSTKDFMKFLDYSRGSVAETVSHNRIADAAGEGAERGCVEESQQLHFLSEPAQKDRNKKEAIECPGSRMMVSQKVVTPVKTGVQRDFNLLILLDTGFRRYDGKVDFPTFCEFIKNGCWHRNQ
jgi:four helix bundle protein